MEPTARAESSERPERGRDPARGVIARLSPPAREIDECIAGWLAHLRAVGRRPSSMRAFRQVVERAVHDAGWRSASDLTYGAVVGYMDSCMERGSWSAATYNRNLSCFRSFTRHLCRVGALADDPLRDADRAQTDEGPDCRAATAAEASAIIRVAWARCLLDGRAAPRRDVYWACLFGQGCRASEPASWRWRHLRLDAPIPHVVWEAAIQKNRRRQEVAIAPWLAHVLRAYRRERSAEGPAAIAPDAPVFPVPPKRHTFRRDCVAAGVAATDERGVGLTMRSARKFFKTEALRLGIPGDMVRRLMRHAPAPDERYYEPTLEDQAAAVARMPDLWPAKLSTDSPQGYPQHPRGAGKNLTAGGAAADNAASSAMADHAHQHAMPATAAVPASRSNSGMGQPLAGSSLVMRAATIGAGNADYRPHFRDLELRGGTFGAPGPGGRRHG